MFGQNSESITVMDGSQIIVDVEKLTSSASDKIKNAIKTKNIAFTNPARVSARTYPYV